MIEQDIKMNYDRLINDEKVDQEIKTEFKSVVDLGRDIVADSIAGMMITNKEVNIALKLTPRGDTFDVAAVHDMHITEEDIVSVS